MIVPPSNLKLYLIFIGKHLANDFKISLLISLVLVVVKIFTLDIQVAWLFYDYYTFERGDKITYFRGTIIASSELTLQILESN